MTETKWRKIYDELLGELRSGVYPQGSRFPALDELCRRYEAVGSKITLRRVYDELKKNGYITARDKRGAFVTEPVQKLNIFLCNRLCDEDIFKKSASIRRLYEVMCKYSNCISWNITPVSVDYALEHAEEIKGPMIVFFSSFIDAGATEFKINHERIREFRTTFNPLVFDCCENLDGLHQIRNDRYSAFKQAVKYLIAHGHRKIGFLSQMVTFPGVLERFKGYLDGMAEAGVLVDGSWIKTVPRNRHNFVDDAMDEWMAQESSPSAIVCANDQKAINVIDYCKRHGIAVPEQLSVIGFDNIPESAQCDPGLTTFSLLPDEAGRYLMDYVKLHHIGVDTRLMKFVIQPELIERGSVEFFK